MSVQTGSEGWPSKGDKIEEELEKLRKRRDSIWDDLQAGAITLSAPTQVTLIAEIASIDVSIKEMKEELEEMGWQDFMSRLWNGEGDS